MFKRILVTLAVALLLTVSVSANKEKLYDELVPDGEFYTYGQDNDKIAELFNLEQAALKAYIGENSIRELFVSKDNTKQIRLTFETTDFSNSIINLSYLSNDSILSLTPDIIGIEGVKGQVLEKQGQKFVKTQLKSADSGGEYILTEYLTVADRSKLTLSFYTQYGTDMEYIENTFNSFSSPLFISNEEQTPTILYITLIGGIVFGVVCIIIAFTIALDMKKRKTEKADFSQEENE